MLGDLLDILRNKPLGQPGGAGPVAPHIDEDFQIGPTAQRSREMWRQAFQEARARGMSDRQATVSANESVPQSRQQLPPFSRAEQRAMWEAEQQATQRAAREFREAGGSAQRFTQRHLQERQRRAEELFQRYKPANGKPEEVRAARERAEVEAGTRRDLSKPLMVFDPYGRLQPGQRQVGPDISTVTEQAARYGIMAEQRQQALTARASYGPPAAHVMEEQAFEQYIYCLDPQSLTNLLEQLKQQKRVLEQPPRTRDRNTQLSRIRMKISKVNIQLSMPKPCPTGTPSAPITAMPPAPGIGPITEPQDPMSRYLACLEKQRRGAKIRCIPPAGFSSPIPSPGSPGGITVSTMPIRETGIPGEEVVVNAPLLDLYATYMDRGLTREAEALRIEGERLLDDVEFAESEAPYMTPIPPQTAMEAEGAEAFFDPGVPLYDTAIFGDEILESSVAPPSDAAGGPVAMSATATVPEGETNWLPLVAAGALILAAVGMKSPKAKAKKRK